MPEGEVRPWAGRVIHGAIRDVRSPSLNENLWSTWETTEPEVGCLPSGIETHGCAYRWPPARARLCAHTFKKPVYKHQSHTSP